MCIEEKAVDMLLMTGLLVVLYAFAFVMTHKGHHGIILAGLSLGGALLLSIDIASSEPGSFTLLKVMAPIVFILFVGLLGVRAVATVKKNALSSSSSQSARSLYGAQGYALSDLNPSGVVQVYGETWSAEALHGTIRKGSTINVAEVNGIHLVVWSEDLDKTEPENTK